MIWIKTQKGWVQFEAPCIKEMISTPPLRTPKCWQESGYKSYGEWLRKTL